MFTVHHLSLKIQHKTLVAIPNLTIQSGKFTALIGPNGAGKTTFLNLLAGDLIPTSGTIELDGQSLTDYSIEELAIKRSVLPQSEHIPFAIKSQAILLMGVMPHHVHFSHPKVLELLAHISEILELNSLLDVPYQILSGGEQHRVQIGRVLMQTLFSLEESPILSDKVMLLDEPFNHLDLYHQQQLLRYFKSLTKQGLTIICVMHDLNHALQVSDQIVLLKKGVLQGSYSPHELWDSQTLQDVFKVDFMKLHHLENPNISALAFQI